MSSALTSERPVLDPPLADIADYVTTYLVQRSEALIMARYCVMDAMGCAMEALKFDECTKLLGPVIPGITVQHGARVPGTAYRLDPVTAAFNIGCLIRWLDLNDAFTAAQGGHPSDNLGAILAVADYVSALRAAADQPLPTMRDVLIALIKAYEIQGVASLENDFTGLGFDPTVMVRIASSAVATHMLGGGRDQIINALSNAWADGVPLKAYRQAPNTGTRKSWASGDATSRGVYLALLMLKGEMGYPSVLSARKFGFYDAWFKGRPFKFQREYGTYVVENVLFKSVASGMHAQSAAECAFRLHPLVKDRLDDIAAIEIGSQKALIGIMDKRGPLNNPADRDHCAQYVIAIGLMHGRLSAECFEDEFAAADPRIDVLREKMNIVENPQYSRDFVDPQKRSSANAIQVRFKDGTTSPRIEVEYPIGHRSRRGECLPMLEKKFEDSLAQRFPASRRRSILELFRDQQTFEQTTVQDFVSSFIIS